MFIRDCHLVCREVTFGYSPKTDDQTWCQIRRDVLEESYDGANIVGDGKFTWARDHLHRCHFYCPVRKPRSRRGEIQVLTKLQKRDNKALRNIRSDVETPFGWMEENITLLRVPWRESKDSQDDLVHFATAVWNLQRPDVAVSTDSNEIANGDAESDDESDEEEQDEEDIQSESEED
jgi:hypothetical protein